MYIYMTKLDEQGDYEIEREKRGIWRGLCREKGKNKLCKYIIISNRKQKLGSGPRETVLATTRWTLLQESSC